MFHYSNGLKLTAIDLAIDFPRRQPLGFISHAHADHMAPHELSLCTPTTAQLYQHRFGPRRVREMTYREPLQWNNVRLTALPSGHIFGSAMLLAETASTTFLYTGDFKLSPSGTAEPIELPQADILIMESTFGDPRYRLPPRDEVISTLIGIIHTAFAAGQTPVIHAYVLGKSQEVTRILADHQIGVLQHPLIYAVSQIYARCGCHLGQPRLYEGKIEAGCVVLMPPRAQKSARMPLPDSKVTIAVTGWAADERARFRLGVDYALPLSDHADYDGLVECVRRVNPSVIYCTHGPREFAGHLRRLGFDAHPLSETRQGRLF